MKKVLIVATTSYAGMGPYVTSIYNTFGKEDNVYFLGREYVEEYFRKNIKEELLPMCTFYKRANTHWNTLVELFVSDKTFENIVLDICKKQSIDVVHYINSPVPVDILKVFHKLNIKTLGTVHDLHPHEANKVWYKMFRHWKGSRIRMDRLKVADNLLTNSLIQLKELREIYLSKNSQYVPFPSLVTEAIAGGTATIGELEKLNKPYILFFGLIEEYKGIDHLLKAYESSPAIQQKYNLVIAGRGDLKEEWLQYKDKGVIFLNRFIKDEEVRSLFENASMVVYPYISATQSGVLSVAFYFGTPTIASDVPFFKSIIEPSGAGLLFKAGDYTSLVSALMNMDGQKAKIEIAEKEYYRNNYDNNSIRSKLLDLYDELV